MVAASANAQPSPKKNQTPAAAPKLSASWPADKVERRSLAQLFPYAKNARTHTPEQVTQLARSIERFGWTMPVLIDEQGEIIAGHGRVMAAAQLELDAVPVMLAKGWTDEQKRAYRLADNQLTLNSSWDQAALGFELKALAGANFDLSLLGFDPESVQNLISGLDSRGGFLSDLADGVLPGAGGKSSSASGMVQLTLSFQPKTRDLIVEYLGKMRDQLSCKTAADALVQMAKQGIGLTKS